jgi:hypothetical protein
MNSLGDVRTIANLQGAEYTLVTDSQEVTDTLDTIGKRTEDYDGLLVKVGDGDYDEVWGFCGTTPYLSKLTKLIYVS